MNLLSSYSQTKEICVICWKDELQRNKKCQFSSVTALLAVRALIEQSL